MFELQRGQGSTNSFSMHVHAQEKSQGPTPAQYGSWNEWTQDVLEVVRSPTMAKNHAISP